MTFKEIFESPVGKVGRTGVNDANSHVTPELEKKFRQIVKELGGKTVAKVLLQKMNLLPPQINSVSLAKNITEAVTDDEELLIKHNIKIKSKFRTKFGTEYVLAKKYDEDKIEKILKKYKVTFDGNSIFVS